MNHVQDVIVYDTLKLLLTTVESHLERIKALEAKLRAQELAPLLVVKPNPKQGPSVTEGGRFVVDASDYERLERIEKAARTAVEAWRELGAVPDWPELKVLREALK